MRPDHALPPPSTPGPNPRNKLASPIVNTPPAIFNTPSKLDRFLQSAEKNGIPGVVLFHLVLSKRGYGPDIMHLIKISDLVDIGMPPGDAIRLKEYAVRWWADERRRVAKRPHEVEITPTLPLPADSTPPSKRLRFEQHFNDGGAARYYSPDVRSGNCEDVDHTWWVYSKELLMFVPLPMGKLPILDDGNDY
jgi:hypothetical protein